MLSATNGSGSLAIRVWISAGAGGAIRGWHLNLPSGDFRRRVGRLRVDRRIAVLAVLLGGICRMTGSEVLLRRSRAVLAMPAGSYNDCLYRLPHSVDYLCSRRRRAVPAVPRGR